MGRRLLTLALCGAGCNAHLGPASSSNVTVDGTPSGDGQGNSDAYVLGAWGTPMPVPGASSTANAEDDLTLSSAGTEMIFAVASGGNKDLYVMTRPTTADPFGAPAALGVFNTSGTEESPRLSPDDLTLYFGRDGDIMKSTRSSVGGTWSSPAVVTGSGDTGSYEKWLAVCANDDFMVSRDNGASGQDLFEGTLGSAGTLVAELSSSSNEISTFLSPDCLTVYFASNRSGQTMIYTSTRTAVGSPFPTPTMVGTPFDSGTDNEDAWISTDQRIFVFASVRDAGTNKDIYISTR
jgi:Tol biopolymer transport system component